MSPSISTYLLHTQSDERLLASAREGHERAFEALVSRYRKQLLRYCGRLLLPDGSAEDALQQGLLQAWLALRRGAEVRDARAWLYRIVHNAAIDALRSSGYDHEELSESLWGAGAPHADLERRIAVRQALAGLAALPELQREALLRTAVEGHSHEDVAAALGLSDGAVRGLVYRARVTLRTAATAITPPPLVVWAVNAGRRAAPLTQRVGEVASGGAAAGATGGALFKGGAAVLTAGAVFAGAAAVHRVIPGRAHNDRAIIARNGPPPPPGGPGGRRRSTALAAGAAGNRSGSAPGPARGLHGRDVRRSTGSRAMLAAAPRRPSVASHPGAGGGYEYPRGSSRAQAEGPPTALPPGARGRGSVGNAVIGGESAAGTNGGYGAKGSPTKSSSAIGAVSGAHSEAPKSSSAPGGGSSSDQHHHHHHHGSGSSPGAGGSSAPGSGWEGTPSTWGSGDGHGGADGPGGSSSESGHGAAVTGSGSHESGSPGSDSHESDSDGSCPDGSDSHESDSPGSDSRESNSHESASHQSDSQESCPDDSGSHESGAQPSAHGSPAFGTPSYEPGRGVTPQGQAPDAEPSAPAL